ncbi:MAG: alginate export family protein, partial [Bryobacterales bacterium]|nr:alginate export family protein [Bryobacterales bacterium]
NLHGVYASLGSPIPGSHVEPYVLYRTNHNAGVHFWTSGLRMAGTVRKDYKYEAEFVHQERGEAATVQVQRLFPKFAWQPSVMGEANYAGRDFDQLYPTNHGIYGIADQIGRRNAKNVRGGLWLHPERWLTVKAEGHSFWLADRSGGLYAFNGAASVAAVAGGAASGEVGKEVDVLSEVKLSKHYDIGVQYGHLFAGDFLKRYTAGAGRSFYAVYVDLRLQ